MNLGLPSIIETGRAGSVYRPAEREVLFHADAPVRYGDFLKALAAVGVGRGDALVLHSEATTFGKLGEVRARSNLADALLSAAREAVGEEGTLILPTFTYSFTRGLPYDPLDAKPTIGLLPERFVEWPGLVRSNNPMFSYAAVGADAGRMVESDIHYCFGEGSLNAKLIRGDAKFCFFGQQGLQMITAVHSVECELGVPYRTVIPLQGKLVLDGQAHELRQEFFARRLDLGLVADFTRLEALIRHEGSAREEKVGWGKVMVADARAIREAAMAGYRKDPAFLVRKQASAG